MQLANMELESLGTVSNWVDLLEAAMREVFQVMLSSELTRAPADASHEGNVVTGFIGIGGDLRGVVMIITGMNSARQMASAMLGIPLEGADSATSDALGEICNMVAGNFKGKLAGTADHCVLSLPTVVTGADYHLHVLSNGEAFETRLLFHGQLVCAVLEIYRTKRPKL